jgi:hypothetical protein
MLTFGQLWDCMQSERLGEGHGGLGETPAMQAVRTGLNQSDDFWDQFLLVCNNAEHLADLLGVPAQKIASWRPRVQKELEKVRRADEQPDDTTEDGTKKEMLPTGGGEDIADPEGYDAPKNGYPETRPY